MMTHAYVHPREFHRCVELLTRKIEEIAKRAGVSEAEFVDLEGVLAALPPVSRERAAVVLQGISIQADEEFPAMAFAASYLLKLAGEIWETRRSPASAVAAAATDGRSKTC